MIDHVTCCNGCFVAANEIGLKILPLMGIQVMTQPKSVNKLNLGRSNDSVSSAGKNTRYINMAMAVLVVA